MEKTTEDITDTTLYGIHTLKVDSKKRIFIPTEWRELLKSGDWVYMLYTWHYLIVAPDRSYQWNPDIIVYKHQIDASGRVLIGDKLLEGLDITMDIKVTVIGKLNHFELYLDPQKVLAAKSRAEQAASHFQALLLGQLK